MPTHRSARKSPLPALVAGVSLLVLSALGTATPAYAADEATVDGVTYELVNAADPSQGATAKAYTASANPDHPELVIPPSVEIDGETVPVIEVGNSAFQNANLGSVVIPSSVVTLGQFAFDGNGELNSVELSEGLVRIGNLAFRDAALTAIDIPETVSRIDFQAFRGNSLVAVELPASLSQIGGGVFYDNPSLERVRLVGPHPQLLFADGNPIGASDAATNPVIEFFWRYGQDQVPAGTDGYTAPQMWGYSSVALAEVTFEAPSHSVHATRLVPLDRTGDDGFWGTIETDDLPDDPVRTDHEFAYWLDHSRNMRWDSGVAIAPVIGDTVLYTGWIDLRWVSSIILTATPEEATVGETVTLTAEGFNANGVSLGDITDEIVFNDPNDNRILFEGNRVTFSEEGTYTITGHHSVTERPVSIVIDARPASTTLPDDEDDEATHEDDDSTIADDEESVITDNDGGPAVPETEQHQTLPATGAEIGLWTGVVGALLLAIGAGLLIARRHSTIANGSTP